MPARTVFLDTSFVIALENKDDVHHERAKALDRELLSQDARLLLHWGILLEIADGFARIDRRAKGNDLLARFRDEEGYRIHPITDELLLDSIGLYHERPDKQWTLTDCISFVLMEREGVTEALTADIHFRQAGFIAMLLDAE